MHDHENHGSAPNIFEIKRQLGAAAGVDACVAALARGFFERLADDELVGSVPLASNAEDVRGPRSPSGGGRRFLGRCRS